MFHKALHAALAGAVLIAAAALAACSYWPERTIATFDDVVGRPGGRAFAVAVAVSRQRDPAGFPATFPDGGAPRVLAREARIYLVDMDRESVALAGKVPDFGGIPQPKQAVIGGWSGDRLFFSLFGYGGDARSGDDMNDPRRLHYVIEPDGSTMPVDAAPAGLERQANSGPSAGAPFLRFSAGLTEIDIWVDALAGQSPRSATLSLNPMTGEPTLVRGAGN